MSSSRCAVRRKRGHALQSRRQALLLGHGSQGGAAHAVVLPAKACKLVVSSLCVDSSVGEQKAMPVKVQKQSNLPTKVGALICCALPSECGRLRLSASFSFLCRPLLQFCSLRVCSPCGRVISSRMPHHACRRPSQRDFARILAASSMLRFPYPAYFASRNHSHAVVTGSPNSGGAAGSSLTTVCAIRRWNPTMNSGGIGSC